MSLFQIHTWLKDYKFRSICTLLLLGITITGCLMNANSQNTEQVQTNPSTPDLSQSIFWLAWESSNHADTYDLEKGPNTYCAKCHSPLNWDPDSVIDAPPNCVTCKFSHEYELRVAEGNPLVPEDEWKDIGCESCHMVDEGVVNEQIAWYNAQTNFYETMTDSTSLCEKCHLDNETLRHMRELGTYAHANFTCTTCHDPHSTVANCGAEGCHLDIIQDRLLPSDKHIGIQSMSECLTCHPLGLRLHSMETRQIGEEDCLGCHSNFKGLTREDIPPLQHSLIHASVSCTACHDASGYEFGINEETGEWVTYRSVELLGRHYVEAYQSHNLQRYVVCTRCHYEDNPWQLPDVVQENATD